MVSVFLVRPNGKFPGQTKILKWQSRFPDWDVPNGNSFTIYKFLEFRISFMLYLESSLARRDNPEISGKW